MSEFLDYGELTSEMIRDRLVIGIRDRHLSECLQLDLELTLEKEKGKKGDPSTQSCAGSAEHAQRSHGRAFP